MCLILFAWKAHPEFPLVVAANRDEFHRRPTAPAAFWQDRPGILAGRDLEAGGSWLGVNRQGRFAAVTNYREPAGPGHAAGRSRGALVTDFLDGEQAPAGFAAALSESGGDYSGFNLLLGDGRELWWLSNRAQGPAAVAPGVHGLSNHLLDTDWPKVHAGREQLQEILASGRPLSEGLFELLTDRRLTPGDWPQGLDPALVGEQLARHFFIESPEYGTRCSTVLLVSRDGELSFEERQFGPGGDATGSRSFSFDVAGGAGKAG